MSHKITPEMTKAWRALRNFAHTAQVAAAPQPWESELAEAIDVLDNSDFMVPIEEACLPTHPPKTPLDSAEWGDTTREDMARHQGRPPYTFTVDDVDEIK